MKYRGCPTKDFRGTAPADNHRPGRFSPRRPIPVPRPQTAVGGAPSARRPLPAAPANNAACGSGRGAAPEGGTGPRRPRHVARRHPTPVRRPRAPTAGGRTGLTAAKLSLDIRGGAMIYSTHSDSGMLIVHMWRRTQEVRQRSAKPLCTGSNPVGAFIHVGAAP
jgi:hypothetical protein